MTEHRLNSARERLARIEEQLEGLRIDRALVVREIELLVGSEQSQPGARTDRIVAALRELGEATPAQLLVRLQLEEPELEAGVLRATLAHLMKRGSIERPRRGVYRASGGERGE